MAIDRNLPKARGPRTALALALGGALALVSPAARPNGQSSSQSNTSNTSTGSGGSSGDSSKSSADSSNNSNDSSKSSSNNTNDSSKNSPKNSTDDSSKGSSDTNGGHAVSIALAAIVVGASVTGVLVSVHQTGVRQGQQSAAALAAFMRRQHPVIAHDVALGSGPVLDGWASELGLSALERRRLRGAIEGSAEQAALLDALDAAGGTIDEEHARRFAAAFLRVTARAVGPARTQALIARAARGG